jgi:hypothetical protein
VGYFTRTEIGTALGGLFVLCFAYLGICERKHTAFYTLPLAIPAYVAMLRTWDAAVAIRLIVAVAVWTLLAELLSHLMYQQHLVAEMLDMAARTDELTRLANRRDLEVRLARTFGKPIYAYDLVDDYAVLVLMSDEDGVARPGDVAKPAPLAAAEFSRRAGDDLGIATEGDVTDLYVDGRFVTYQDNPLRHTFSSGGIKDNRGKPRVDLLPSKPLLAIAEVLGFGAQKYQPHNWRRGLPWGDTYASLQRHLLSWNAAEDLDPESKFSHLSNAGCQLMFLLEFVITDLGVETDSRFILCLDDQCAIEGRHPISDHLREVA